MKHIYAQQTKYIEWLPEHGFRFEDVDAAVVHEGCRQGLSARVVRLHHVTNLVEQRHQYLSLYNITCDINHSPFITARQECFGEVMLSVVSSFVSHSVHSGGPHVTITHDALDLTVQCPRPSAWDPLAMPPPPASNIWGSSLETCSNLFTVFGDPWNDI